MARRITREQMALLRHAFSLGSSIRQAAAMAGCGKNTAKRHMDRWRDLPPRQNTTGQAVNINTGDIWTRVAPEQKHALVIAAQARGDSLTNFVGTLLDTIVTENLFAAILDE